MHYIGKAEHYIGKWERIRLRGMRNRMISSPSGASTRGERARTMQLPARHLTDRFPCPPARRSASRLAVL